MDEEKGDSLAPQSQSKSKSKKKGRTASTDADAKDAKVDAVKAESVEPKETEQSPNLPPPEPKQIVTTVRKTGVGESSDSPVATEMRAFVVGEQSGESTADSVMDLREKHEFKATMMTGDHSRKTALKQQTPIARVDVPNEKFKKMPTTGTVAADLTTRTGLSRMPTVKWSSSASACPTKTSRKEVMATEVEKDAVRTERVKEKSKDAKPELIEESDKTPDKMRLDKQQKKEPDAGTVAKTCLVNAPPKAGAASVQLVEGKPKEAGVQSERGVELWPQQDGVQTQRGVERWPKDTGVQSQRGVEWVSKEVAVETCRVERPGEKYPVGGMERDGQELKKEVLRKPAYPGMDNEQKKRADRSVFPVSLATEQEMKTRGALVSGRKDDENTGALGGHFEESSHKAVEAERHLRITEGVVQPPGGFACRSVRHPQQRHPHQRYPRRKSVPSKRSDSPDDEQSEQMERWIDHGCGICNNFDPRNYGRGCNLTSGSTTSGTANSFEYLDDGSTWSTCAARK